MINESEKAKLMQAYEMVCKAEEIICDALNSAEKRFGDGGNISNAEINDIDDLGGWAYLLHERIYSVATDKGPAHGYDWD